MTNPKLGDKHICKDCDARFFDMKKRPATCPKCGLEVTAAKTTKARRPPPEAAPVDKPDIAKALPPADTADDSGDDLDKIITIADIEPEEKNLDDDDDDKLIEDASDLGEDDDDLLEVREHMDDEVVDKS